LQRKTIHKKGFTIQYFSTLNNLLSYNISAIILKDGIAVIIKVISQILFTKVLFEYDGDIQRLLSSKKASKKK